MKTISVAQQPLLVANVEYIRESDGWRIFERNQEVGFLSYTSATDSYNFCSTLTNKNIQLFGNLSQVKSQIQAMLSFEGLAPLLNEPTQETLSFEFENYWIKVSRSGKWLGTLSRTERKGEWFFTHAARGDAPLTLNGTDEEVIQQLIDLFEPIT